MMQHYSDFIDVASQEGCKIMIENFMVLNHAAQALANVKIEKRVSPLSCFIITVAESGERKTSVESITLQITQGYQTRLEEKYKQDLSLYKKELFFYEAALKKLLAWVRKRFTPQDEVDRVYLLRSGPPKLRSKATLDPLLGQLEDRGFIQRTAPNKWKLSPQARAYEDPKPLEFPPFTGKETFDFKA